MKIRKIEDVAPIHVLNGDTLKVLHQDENGETTVLCSDTFTSARVIDRVAIVELEDDELAVLGMEQGIGGVVGKRAEGL